MFLLVVRASVCRLGHLIDFTIGQVRDWNGIDRMEGEMGQSVSMAAFQQGDDMFMGICGLCEIAAK